MQLLTTASQGFAHADLNPVSLQPTLGGFELVFGLQLRTVTPDPVYWAELHGAGVHIAGGQGAFVKLGQARPIAPVRVRTTTNSLMSTCEFRLPLTAGQSAAIEDLRDSGDLQMKLVIAGEGGPIGQLERIDPVNNDLFAQIPRSAWIWELGAAKALDVLLLEISMPFESPLPAPSGFARRATDRPTPLGRGQLFGERGAVPDGAGGDGGPVGPGHTVDGPGLRYAPGKAARDDQGPARAGAGGGASAFHPPRLPIPTRWRSADETPNWLCL